MYFVSLLTFVGIIQTIKSNFKKKLFDLRFDHEYSDSTCDVEFRISLYDAISLLVSVYSSLSVDTIQKCWRKTGLFIPEKDSISLENFCCFRNNYDNNDNNFDNNEVNFNDKINFNSSLFSLLPLKKKKRKRGKNKSLSPSSSSSDNISSFSSNSSYCLKSFRNVFFFLFV